MHIRELRRKSQGELQKVLAEKRARVIGLRFRVLGGRVKNVKEMREVKKDIARALTLLHTKE